MSHTNFFKAAWENTLPASAECQEVKVEAFSDEEEILRDDDIRPGWKSLTKIMGSEKFDYPMESCDDPMPIYVVENDYSDEEPSSAESDDAETLQEWNKY